MHPKTDKLKEKELKQKADLYLAIQPLKDKREKKKNLKDLRTYVRTYKTLD